MRNTSRFATKQGTVTVTPEAVTIPVSRWLPMVTRTLRPEDVREVRVGGRDRQYVTGRRAAGVVLTGGAALLAPARMRGMLVIATTGGDVYEFTLKRKDAKRPEAVAAAFSARGYEVR